MSLARSIFSIMYFNQSESEATGDFGGKAVKVNGFLQCIRNNVKEMYIISAVAAGIKTAQREVRRFVQKLCFSPEYR